MRRQLLGVATAVVLAACGPVPPDAQTGGPGDATATATPPGGSAAPAVALAPDCADLDVPATVDGPLADDPAVAVAQQQRAGRALASDIATVEQLIAAGADQYALGFPHTEAEFDEVMGRNAAGDQSGAIRAWVDSEGVTGFAGLWLDQAAGGVLTVAFTGELDEYRAEVAERFGPEIAVVGAHSSMAELDEIRAGLRPYLTGGGDDPAQGTIFGHGIREDINRVAVAMIGESEEVRAALSEEFGAQRLCFEVDPIPTAADAGPASWAPVAAGGLDAGTAVIDVLVVERACSGGDNAAGRITEPEISYGPDTVVVTLRVIPKPGVNTCPGNEPTPYTLILDEPLGGRTLDGGTDPPSPPHLDQ